MYGAIIGDIVGSAYEFRNIKTKTFPLFSPGCDYTDDSLMTIAVAQALSQPYGSFGNGSAMRVSPCGLYAATLEEALELAKASAEVTHDHPEGIKGAQATAAAIYLARTGSGKEVIRDHIRENFYPLEQTLDEIRPSYGFDESCQGTVPQAIQAFLEADSFEDAIRNAISLGGDSDTLGAITGSIAWSYFRAQNGGSPTEAMESIRATAAGYLPADLAAFAEEFPLHCPGEN